MITEEGVEVELEAEAEGEEEVQTMGRGVMPVRN